MSARDSLDWLFGEIQCRSTGDIGGPQSARRKRARRCKNRLHLAFESLEIRAMLANQLLIPGGFDLLQTVEGPESFRQVQIPADFFAPGSDPFTGLVFLEGNPIQVSPPPTPFLPLFGGPAQAGTGAHQELIDPRLGDPFAPFDTVVRRPPVFLDGPPETVPIEIVQLNLVSVQPITVTYNGGQNPEPWDMRVNLSATTPQVPGTMVITRTSPNGGTFNSTLPVRPLLVFTKVSAPLDQRLFEEAPEIFVSSGNFQVPIVFPDTQAEILIASPLLPLGTETLTLFGPTSVLTNLPPNGQAGDSGGVPGLDDTSTNMFQLDLTGNSPTLGAVHVRLNRNIQQGQAFGRIEEQVNNTAGVLDVAPYTPTGQADSFFDVFFEIVTQAGTFHNNQIQPAHVQATLSEVPPAVGEMFSSNQTLQLFDSNEQPVPITVLQIKHTPRIAVDFGDAPDPTYPTLLASNGARHAIVPGFYLGSAIDGEPDGQPHTAALGDDLIGIPDDEDGVVFTTPILPGAVAGATVTASAPGFLDAWLDFNSDGDWSDAGEQIFTSVPLAAGANPLTFSVPVTASLTKLTFARFRFSSAGGLSVVGFSRDGEVEDYAIGSFIHGQKFHDLNNNGRRDLNDVGLNNFTIDLFDELGQNLISTTQTMDMELDGIPGFNPVTERGIYWFPNLPPDTYRIRERSDVSLQTYPASLGSTEYVITIGFGQSLGVAPAESQPFAGPGDHFVDHARAPFVPSSIDAFFSVARIQLQSQNPLLGNFTEEVFLSGDTQVRRGQPHASSPSAPCEFDTIDTEMLQLDLRGSAPILGDVRVRAGHVAGVSNPTMGNIQERPSDPSLADSFFDVFFEIDTQFGTLHNNQPLRISAVLDRLPPLLTEYQHPISPIELFDPLNQPTGVFITQALHIPTFGVDFGNRVLINYDFGDAPDPRVGRPAGEYPTLDTNAGAKHQLGGGLFLGLTVDADLDGQPNAVATGDDLDVDGDDEDGVTLPATIIPGLDAAAIVTASLGGGKLDAWIDFNNNGEFEMGFPEQIASGLLLVAGANMVTFFVPDTAPSGTTFARFRLSTAGGLLPTGEASDGEVEDYALAIDTLTPGCRIVSDPLSPSAAASLLLCVGSNGRDKIEFQKGSAAGIVRVRVNGRPSIEFVPGRLAALGLGGKDEIVVSAKLDLAAELNGGAGDDELSGSSGDDVLRGGTGKDRLVGAGGNDVLFGGAGDDKLEAGTGHDVLVGDSGRDELVAQDDHDVLIGGTDRDQLKGGKGHSLLIGGTTDFDKNLDALRAIRNEWALGPPIVDRVAHLVGTSSGGLNGAVLLQRDGLTISGVGTVHDDGAKDKLKGSSAVDWFFAFALDELSESGADLINHLLV